MKLGKLFFLILFVSVMGYSQVPLSDNLPASGVLGAPDFVTNTNYASPTDSTLSEPYGVAVDPTTGKLFVADRDNRRVLRFSSVSKMINGGKAEVVFGQPDFVTRTRNTNGPSASTLNAPYGLYVDATGILWVADTENNRVLRYNNASAKLTGAAADGVLGQPDFVTIAAGITAAQMDFPTEVRVDLNGRLWVADKNNNRILRFDNAASKSNGASADGVIGQTDFVTKTAGVTASTLDAPWGLHVDDAGRLWVADRNNNRILRFDNAASKPNGGTADGVLGQSDFVTGSTDYTSAKRFKFVEPRSAFMDGLGRLFVADEGNTRILVFNNAALKANGANADFVLGQPDFTTNTSALTQTGMNYPARVFVDNNNNHIWVPDAYNHRVLRFNVAPLPVELVSFSAVIIDGKVQLSWTTATENNNSGFSVERKSTSGWTEVGFVKGIGTTTETSHYSFIDNASIGKYSYRLKQIDNDGTFKYSYVVEVSVGFNPDDYKLAQNYPNPFNPSTTISFIMQSTEYAVLTIHNVLGETIETLFSGVANADQVYTFNFNAKNLTSGVYFYSLRSSTRNEIRKMSLLK